MNEDLSLTPDATTQNRTLTVPEGLAGQRLDAGLSKLLGMSRSKAVALVEAGNVRLDGRPALKSTVLEPGQWLDITLEQRDETPEVVAEPVPGMAVVHDDDDFVVVDKPAGVAAHPSVGWTGPTVVGGLAAAGYRISTSGASERQGIVHRLDVGTSGLMAVAKSERAYSILKNYFRNREVKKVYHALVQGMPDPLEGTIDAPIGRHPNHDWKFAVMDGGRESVTHYELLEAFGRASLMEVHLETGRTHQIRVHFSAMHHPCVGDPTYGSNPKLSAELGLERQWLHAYQLGFVHPSTGEWVEFTCDYPADLQHALDLLRNP